MRHIDFRTDTSHLRWLILAALGFASACGGKAPVGECTSPMDLGGGFARCADGSVHRVRHDICPSELPRARDVPALDAPTNTSEAAPSVSCPPGGCCQRDSDCVAQPHGHCEPLPGSSSQCKYGCVVDSECGPGYVCLCGSPVGGCVPAFCSVDADCTGGAACAQYDYYPGCGQIAFGCQSPADECVTANDCPPEQPYCTMRNDRAPRVCSAPQCAIGRPFLVGAEARLARCEPRADWYAAGDVVPRLSSASELGDRTRAALREGWMRQGLMEHASVAAFARFALQLTALGAPAELLHGAAAAMQDEIRHARGCFELARRHSDTDLGPGPLPLDGALDVWDRESVVLATIVEGCIGETVAAMEAIELLAQVTDPAARTLLEGIARDEAEHARLAWRFVAWALETGPVELRDAVARAFREELSAPIGTEPERDAGLEATLLEHGLASEPLRRRLGERVRREIVLPCAEALLGSPRRRPSSTAAVAVHGRAAPV